MASCAAKRGTIPGAMSKISALVVYFSSLRRNFAIVRKGLRAFFWLLLLSGGVLQAAPQPFAWPSECPKSAVLAGKAGSTLPCIPPPSPALLARTRHYVYGGIFWGTLAQLWSFAVLGFLIWSGIPVRWRNQLLRRLRAAWVRDAAFGALLLLVLGVAGLPFSIYLGFFRERAFGFEHLSVAGWLGDWCKFQGVEIALGTAAILIVYAVLRRAGRNAWVWVWAACTLLMIFSVVIEPVAIEPLFNHFKPLPAGQLRQELLAEAQRAGIPSARIYVVNRSRQSAHTNAYVTGLFGSSRIVLYDTLLHAETAPEIEFVLGHEMGHYVENHVWLGVAFGSGLLFVLLGISFALYRRGAPGWGYEGVADIAGLPMLGLTLSVLFFLAMPLSNGFSRHLEHRADAFGLRVCPNPAAAVVSFERDVWTDLIDPAPPRWLEWWFYTHPSNAERMGFAEQYCRAHGVRWPGEP